METTQMAKQMITYQKTLFESAFNAVCTLQDQTEKVAAAFMDQMTWLPKESRQTLKDSAEMFKTARETYKKTIFDGYDRLEELFSGKSASASN